MKSYRAFLIAASAAVVALLATSTPVALGYTNPITTKGYKMFDAATGEYFAVKGIDYYPRANSGDLDANNIDLFTDDYQSIWENDIEYLAASGANAVRLYAVDPTQSHDAFMCALRSHGMYALVELGSSCDGCSIGAEAYPSCYSTTLKSRGQAIIDAFSQYDNLLAFSAGNEANDYVTNSSTNAPCQKKFARDMREYIAGCGTLRQIPVGVVVADIEREDNALYYTCRTDASDEYENVDFYGINAYQYCDGSVTEMDNAEGFMKLLTDFQGYNTSVPVLLTEFGCLNPSFPTVNDYEAQRTWLQAGWLFSDEFRDVFNGGFVFEYATELANSNATSPYPFTAYGDNNFGLGYFSPEDCDHTTTTCVYNPMPNYDDLATQFNATDVSGEAAMTSFTAGSGRTATGTCPEGWAALSDIDWSTVEAVTLTCPTAAVEYTCPGQTSSGTWTASTASGSKPSTGGSGSTSSSTATSSVTTSDEGSESEGSSADDASTSASATEASTSTAESSTSASDSADSDADDASSTASASDATASSSTQSTTTTTSSTATSTTSSDSSATATTTANCESTL